MQIIQISPKNSFITFSTVSLSFCLSSIHPIFCVFACLLASSFQLLFLFVNTQISQKIRCNLYSILTFLYIYFLITTAISVFSVYLFLKELNFMSYFTIPIHRIYYTMFVYVYLFMYFLLVQVYFFGFLNGPFPASFEYS